MKNENIMITTESEKNLEIINQVNPYRWAQERLYTIESQMFGMSVKMMGTTIVMFLIFLGIINMTEAWHLWAAAFFLCGGLFLFNWYNHNKLEKEHKKLKTEFRNGKIKENMEESFLSVSKQRDGHKERLFLLFELPNLKVIDYEVVEKDGHASLKIVTEMENGNILTRNVSTTPDCVEFNRRTEHVQITVTEHSTKITLPFEYY